MIELAKFGICCTSSFVNTDEKYLFNFSVTFCGSVSNVPDSFEIGPIETFV